MRLVTFRRGRGEPKPGALFHEHVLDLGGLAKDLAVQRGTVRRGRGGFPRTILEIVQGDEAVRGLVREAVEHGQRLVGQTAAEDLAQRRLAYPLKRVRLLAPIPSPSRNIFCLGRNYADHAAERGAAAPEHPVYFTKPATSVVGPGDDVVHHAITKELDYEVELAVVIGTGGRDIPRADALKHVFGYTIINDVTARDLQKKHQQWFKGKSLDTFCPMGPVLVTADEMPDPQALAISLRVNGQLRQSSHTSKMIFPVAQCIDVLSQGMMLLPGDIIATGTPEGVGAASGNFLKAGDRIEAEVEGIGILHSKVVRPEPGRGEGPICFVGALGCPLNVERLRLAGSSSGPASPLDPSPRPWGLSSRVEFTVDERARAVFTVLIAARWAAG
jgi:2-keto-4-pentenoate hydratase/2-oxohepta-3-ene-1,7-dioic acid hydratase in catechol pathway